MKNMLKALMLESTTEVILTALLEVVQESLEDAKNLPLPPPLNEEDRALLIEAGEALIPQIKQARETARSYHPRMNEMLARTEAAS